MRKALEEKWWKTRKKKQNILPFFLCGYVGTLLSVVLVVEGAGISAKNILVNYLEENFNYIEIFNNFHNNWLA